MFFRVRGLLGDAISVEMASCFVQGLVVATLLTLSFVTITINATVIACVLIEQKLHTTPGIYMFSLAVADGLVGLLLMPVMCIYMVYGSWPLGNEICAMWTLVDAILCTCSMMHILLLAHDRLRALYRPIDYSVTHKRPSYAVKRIVLAWAVATSLLLPGVIYYHYVHPPSDDECVNTPEIRYPVPMSVLTLYAPTLGIIVVYALCVHHLRQRFRAISVVHQHQNAAAPTKGGKVSSVPSYKNTSSVSARRSGDTPSEVTIAHEKERCRRHIRSLRVLGVVITAYIFCWLPFFVLWPITAYCVDCIPDTLYQIACWLTYLHSTINPLIYFIFQRQFREAFVTLKGRMSRCC